MRATVLFKPSVSYRRDAFEAGLRDIGYDLLPTPLSSPSKDDLLVLWNRSHYEEGIARRYEGVGAAVIVAENGYIGSDENGHKLFAMSKHYHNGAGKWNVGASARWKGTIAPWRESGDFILVLPQRGIGCSGVAMPRGWEVGATRRLALMTKRPIRVRRHPGASKEDPYLALVGAWAAVTWGSGAGIKALAYGVPVFHDFSMWIGAMAASRLEAADIEDPMMGDRQPMFERLAWAQWSLAEIQSGEAFRCLLT